MESTSHTGVERKATGRSATWGGAGPYQSSLCLGVLIYAGVKIGGTSMLKKFGRASEAAGPLPRSGSCALIPAWRLRGS